ncbi:hypothetical protein OHZ10_11740 [Burkholderia arboris]|uniref:DUF1851 domain-containing protein n=1 Tax=Burkholderia arboris TaxID=488730 RepID=A0ABZ3DEF2_9BURK|nr:MULTISPECIES: hypothetical protein [Burkholderia cepacia complex]QTD90882.1 hypothetical protein J4G50_05690 [Burkholderia anthina]
MTYEQEFLAAIERTKGFGLVPPAFTVSSKQRWFDADNLTRFPFVVRDALGELDFEDVVGQCMAIHYRLLPALNAWLGCSVFFTIGWIDDETEEGMFRFDEAFIAEMLRTGYVGGTVKLHAWLTLPSMEIVDMSLPTTMGVVQKRPEMLGGAITRYAGELKGMAYKPMLVGDDFLRKTGLLTELRVVSF